MAPVTEADKGHGERQRTREDTPSVSSADFSGQLVLTACRGRSSVQHRCVWGGGMGDAAQAPLQSLPTELYHVVHGMFGGMNEFRMPTPTAGLFHWPLSSSLKCSLALSFFASQNSLSNCCVFFLTSPVWPTKCNFVSAQ